MLETSPASLHVVDVEFNCHYCCAERRPRFARYSSPQWLSLYCVLRFRLVVSSIWLIWKLQICIPCGLKNTNVNIVWRLFTLRLLRTTLWDGTVFTFLWWQLTGETKEDAYQCAHTPSELQWLREARSAGGTLSW